MHAFLSQVCSCTANMRVHACLLIVGAAPPHKQLHMGSLECRSHFLDGLDDALECGRNICSTAQHSTSQHSTAKHVAAQHGMAWQLVFTGPT